MSVIEEVELDPKGGERVTRRTRCGPEGVLPADALLYDPEKLEALRV